MRIRNFFRSRKYRSKDSKPPEIDERVRTIAPEAPTITIRKATVDEPYNELHAPLISGLPSLNENGSRVKSLDSPASSQSVELYIQNELRGSRIRYPPGSFQWFIPHDALETTISNSAVMEILTPFLDIKDASHYAQVVLLGAKRLFATLILIRRSVAICSLLNEGVTDDDLPLKLETLRERSTLMRQSGEHIKSFEGWSIDSLEEFYLKQWWNLAPIFEVGQHYELNKNVVLPFIPLTHNGSTRPKQGGYSEVFPVRIHPAHHDFWESSDTNDVRLVAIKKLFSPDKEEFLKEVDILKILGRKHHPHLMRLLATFRLQETYHLMFPWAIGNLRQFWESRPHPLFESTLVLWSVKQITGIANALFCIHSFRVSVPRAFQSSKGVGKDAELSLKRQDEIFGRHGDIKPENILWIQNDSGAEDDLGTLQIADFGSGRFHSRDSRSIDRSDLIFSSPTYEPPEVRLKWPISRAYDIWSLGCLYLEFITWLLKGAGAIDDFSDFRGEFDLGIDNDDFYSVSVDDAGDAVATVREAVIHWVEELHMHENCSALIHDLLDMIMTKVLVIDSKSRSPTSWLYQGLRLRLMRAEMDQEYMMKPIPRSPLQTSTWFMPLGPSKSSSQSPILRTDKVNLTSTGSKRAYVPKLAPRNDSDIIVPRDIVVSTEITGEMVAQLDSRKHRSWPS